MKKTAFVCVAAAVLFAGQAAWATIYVTTNGTGTGADWSAPTSLTNALAIATNRSEIWLAQGTYTNTATFTVRTNCTLYGGFTNGMAALTDRNWTNYPTLLNGLTQNWRIVTVTGTNVTLDGLSITNSRGGGITKASAGNLTLANCRIVNNLGWGGPNGVGCYFAAGTIYMTNCVVAGNQIPAYGGYIGGKFGIGIYSAGATLDIVDCVISNQSCDIADARSTSGGGLSFDNGTLRVLRTQFIGNRGPDNGAGGGAVYLGNGATVASFSNCVFRGNLVEDYNISYGGAVWANLASASTAAFVNCSFIGNSNGCGNGGAIYISQGTVILRNSILWTNRAPKAGYTAHEIYVAGGSLRATYTCLSGMASPYVFVSVGSATFTNCMTNNPLFASLTDVHLQSTSGRWQNGAWITTDAAYSPSIDAGDPANPVGLEPVENGSRVNLGAYGGTDQASKSPNAAPQVVNRGYSLDYTRATLSGELTNALAVIADVGICYGTNDAGATTNGWQYVGRVYPPQQTGTVFSVVTPYPYLLTNTTYYYRCYATNSYGGSFAAVSNFTIGSAYPPGWGVGGGSNVIHVKADAVGAGNGVDWYNAYPRIADAILALAGTRTNIWITGGTYTEGTLLTLAANATVIGGFAGTETNVAGRTSTNTAGVVTNYTAINGENTYRCLGITAGNIWLDTLTISNSPFAHSLEKSSAGTLVMNNCRIEKNKVVPTSYGGAGNGVGAYFSAGTILMTNCVVADNQLPGPNEMHSNFGYGIYSSGATLDIVDSVISNQYGNPGNARSGKGAGLAFDSGTLRVLRTEFLNNVAAANGGGGGAVYLGNGAIMSATFSNCVFRGNQVQVYGGSIGYGAGVLVNLSSTTKTAAFINCTFAANTNFAVGGFGGAIYLQQGTLVLKNSILWTNVCAGAGSSGHEIYVAAGSLNGSYSDLSGLVSPYVVGAATLVNCMAANPLFAGPTDVHLQSTVGRWQNGTFVTNDTAYSPCIDAGDPADPVGLEPMPNEARINMGAYGGTAQASKSPPNASPLLGNLGAVVNYHRATVSGVLTNATRVTAQVGLCYGMTNVPANTTNGWQFVDPVSAPQQTGVVFAVMTRALLPHTTYSYRWYATNNYGGDMTPSATFDTGDLAPGGGSNVIHVKRGAAGAADGSDWYNAYTKIGDGITALSGTRTNIWITGGTYNEGALLTITVSAAVIGGFVGTESAVEQRALTNAAGVVTNYTAINGEATHQGLKVTASNAWLDTLTLSNAPTTRTLEWSGAGRLVANNCRIVGNTGGGSGVGGYFSAGSVLMTNCVVASNTVTTYSQYGFGIYSSGANLQLVDCLFSNNYGIAFDSRNGKGVGLAFDNGTLSALRTDFIGNSGGVNNNGGGGGAIYLGNSATMFASFSNCVFRGNRALTIGDAGFGGAIWANLNSLSTTIAVVNCTFAGNVNETTGRGGAICLTKGTLIIRNSIFWTNSVQDGVSGREIYADSANSLVINSYTCFTGTNAPYIVATNSAVVQWGAGVITNDPLYASATDVHLKSKGGRYDPANGTFVTTDTLTSPCIDAGDPASAYASEPRPNGNRVNMGAYGNTAQASKTYRPGGTVVVLR